MKKVLLFLVLIAIFNGINAQVAINTDGSTANGSAMLDINSTTKGVLVPRMTSTQRGQISTPANGLLVFDTDTYSFWFYDGSIWVELKGSNNNNELTDADGDTKIQVEKTTDADEIVFELNSKQYFVIDTGRIGVYNTGGSVIIGENAGLHDDYDNHENVFIGKESGMKTNTGRWNTAIGGSTLTENTTGDDNTAIGFAALTNNTTGGGNTSIGSGTLYWNDDGVWNTSLGEDALNNNLHGSSNIGIGPKSMVTNTNSNYNIAIGEYALSSNEFRNNGNDYDSWNLAIGHYAMDFNCPTDTSNGSKNTTVGHYSMYWNRTGTKNTSLGYKSLYSNEYGSYNIAIGSSAMYSAKARSNIVAIGDSALYNNGVGATTTDHGSLNTAVGSKSLYSNNLGYANTAFGNQSMYSTTSGIKNTAIGSGVLILNTTGSNNTANGYLALGNNTTGFSNVGIGIQALFHNTTGHNLVAIGDSALLNQAVNGSGYYGNTAVGSKTLLANTTGAFNTALGSDAGRLITTSSYNTALGVASLNNNLTGNNNTAVGFQALSGTTAENNTALGYQALISNTTGANNTAIGMYANVSSGNLQYATAVGFNSVVGQSNALILGGTGSAYADVGIGTTTPTEILHIESRSATDAAIKVISPDSYQSSIKLFESGNYGYELQYDGSTDKLHLWSRTFSGNEGIRMTWLKNGNVGIGTDSPTYALQIGTSGDGTEARANSWNTFSDKRWKTNIVRINDPVEKLEEITGYYYNWKEGEDQSTQVGVIAQEVEAVLPEIVSTDELGYKSVDYSKLTPLLIEAIKNQQETIRTLEERISLLESSTKE